jgi:hypothetical protein
MATARKHEVVGRVAIQLNPSGGTYPVLFDGSNPKWVAPLNGDQPAGVELLQRKIPEDERVYHEVPNGATGVFFPDFYYESDGNDRWVPNYGDPKFIPFSDFIGSPTA